MQSQIAPDDVPNDVINNPKRKHRDEIVATKDNQLKKIDGKDVQGNIDVQSGKRLARDCNACMENRLQNRNQEDANPDDAIGGRRESLLEKWSQSDQ